MKENRNKKGAIGVEKLIVSSAIVLLSSVVIGGGMAISKDTSTDAVSKMESKSNDIADLSVNEEKPVPKPDPVPEPVDETKTSLTVTVRTQGPNATFGSNETGIGAFSFAGVPLDLNNTYKTIHQVKGLNKNKTSFMYNEIEMRYDKFNDRYFLPYNESGSKYFEKGNVPNTQLGEIGISGSLDVRSAEFTASDVASIADFFKENHKSFKIAGKTDIAFNEKGGLSFKSIKINNKVVPKEQLDYINKNTNSYHSFDKSYFEGISPTYTDYGKGTGTSVDTNQNYIIFDSKTGKYVKAPLSSYLKGLNMGELSSYNFVTESGRIDFAVPIELESAGGLKYNFNATYTLFVNAARVPWQK